MEKTEISSIEYLYKSDDIPNKIIYKNKDNKNEIYENTKDLAEDYISKTYLFQNKKKEKIAVKLIKKTEIINNNSIEEMINIQKSIDRPDFSKFINYFEDNKKNNIFLILEYYQNDSLYDLVKKRSYLTEIEVQNYMTQLIISLNYLHTKKIIHRYLIPLFIFLGDKMDLKIGNFFFAKKVENKEKLDKMYTDPFFMAPEIWLNDNYSFEVDIWSLGIIMFFLLTGNYPFKINVTKENFESNNYNKDNIKKIFSSLKFPESQKISPVAKDLIKQILDIDPSKRPTLNQIIYHDFFNREGMPKYFENSTIEKPPKDFPNEILNEELIVKSLKSLIKPIIEPITYDSINNLNDLKINNIKEIDIYIEKKYDYFQKYGIGYMLNNGFVGVFYRDRTKMVLNTKKNKYKYIEKDKGITNKFTKNNCPENLGNKMNILNEFKSFFDKENKKEKNFDEKEETKINEDINEDKEDNDEIDFIYVENVIFDKYFIFFKLSTQTQQFFFDDNVQMIMSCEILTYKYIIDKKKEKTNFYLKDVLNNPIKELKKRYNYARYSYFKWIDKRIKKNIEKIKNEVKDKGEKEEEKNEIENDNNSNDNKIIE